jgi:hypothetical protein
MMAKKAKYDNSNKGAVWGNGKRKKKGTPHATGHLKLTAASVKKFLDSATTKKQKGTIRVALWLNDDFNLTRKGNMKKSHGPGIRLEVSGWKADEDE